MTTFTVTAESDHLAKVIRGAPIAALAELIWNSLDADATKVSVILTENELGGVEEIVVVDNGNGIRPSDARPRFTKLGGSWKKGRITTSGGRFLHGRDGKGRFKALALGRIATWHVVCEEEDGLKRFQIEIRADDPSRVEITAATPAEKDANPGVRVVVSEVRKAKSEFADSSAHEELTEIFAAYLCSYRDVLIEVDGSKLDPAPHIKSTTSIELTPAVVDGSERPATLYIIEWRDNDHRTLYLANEQGAPLHKCKRKFQVGGAMFTAYLRSEYFSELLDSDGLDLAELNDTVSAWINEAQEEIKRYFDERQKAEDRSLIQEWKDQEIYPFKGPPVSPVEEAEIAVFNIVATHVARHVDDLRSGTRTSRALHLRLLRSAIEKSPNELQTILSEVINLPARDQARLADLLRDTSLSNVINASALVADRLKLIMGLQTILYGDEYSKNLKERTQLHRIVAKNAWLFGEEWNISVDDRSLTQVLRAHRGLLSEDILIDEPVRHVSKTRGIVDLMLSRAIQRYGSAARSHLVVELKAPRVTLTEKECNQIMGYARSIQCDPRFDKVDVNWDFWLLGTIMDDDVRFRVEQSNGVLLGRDDLRIRVKLWSEILEENRSRMQFFKEMLEFEAGEERALEHLADNYGDLLEGVVVDDADSGHESDDAAVRKDDQPSPA